MYVKKAGEGDFHHLKHNKIKKQLKEHMANNNDLVKKLEEKDNLDQAEIVQVFNDYNSWAKTHKG
jgi:energy-converting hydrogenase A subunit M